MRTSKYALRGRFQKESFNLRQDILRTQKSIRPHIGGKSLLLSSGICTGWAINAVIALQGWIGASLAVSIALSATAFYLFRSLLGYWNSLIMLFWFAHTAYGIAGPLVWYISPEDIPLHREILYTDVYIAFYSLSSIGFTLGVLLQRIAVKTRMPNCSRSDSASNFALRAASILVLLVGLANELNKSRSPEYYVTLMLGKGLHGTLQVPTDVFFSNLVLVSVALLGFSLRGTIARTDSKFWFLIIWLALFSPIIAVHLLVGERGFLIFSLFVFVFSFYFDKIFPNLSRKAVFLMLLIYVFSVLIFSARSMTGSLILGEIDIKEYSRDTYENFKRLFLNPASIEFGATFVNFNVFYKSSNFISLYYGETYIRGFSSLVSHFYDKQRKPNIVEEFHYMFYPEIIERGAGFAFSSILEAYWNFGSIGIFGVYLLFGLMLSLLEAYVRCRSFSALSLFYVMLVPTVLRIHRTNFGLALWFIPLLAALVGYMCYLLFKSIQKRQR